MFLTLALTLAACGGSTLRSPAKSGRVWREYRTPHFLLHTDASDRVARETLERLEASHAALRTYVFPFDPPFNRVSDVTLFAGMKNLGALGYEKFDGYFSTALEEFTGESSLVLAGRGSLAAREQVITHELVHRFVEHHLTETPTWLNEGLAKYYESLTWEGNALVLGRHPLASLQTDPETRGIYWFVQSETEIRSIPTLRSMSNEDFYGTHPGANYGSAWAAVSALMEGEGRAKFETYLDALHAGKGSEAEAFRALTGDDEGASFFARQQELATDSSYETEKMTVQGVNPPAFKVAEPTVMAPEAVHRLWARLLSGSHKKEALEHATQALELDPKDPESLFLRGAILWDAATGSVEAVDHFRRAYQASDRAPRYGAALLKVATERSGTVPEASRVAAALTKTARTALEYDALARYLLANHRLNAALRYSKKSIRLEPGRIPSQVTYAVIRANEGDYETALWLLERAQALGGHRTLNISRVIAAVRKEQADALRASAPGVSR